MIIELIQTDPDYRMEGGETLKIRKELLDEVARFEELETLMNRFASRNAA